MELSRKTARFLFVKELVVRTDEMEPPRYVNFGLVVERRILIAFLVVLSTLVLQLQYLRRKSVLSIENWNQEKDGG